MLSQGETVGGRTNEAEVAGVLCAPCENELGVDGARDDSIDTDFDLLKPPTKYRDIAEGATFPQKGGLAAIRFD